MKRILLAAVAACALATSAQANITPVLQSVAASGSNFLYTYQVTLDSDQALVNGSKTSIFDFAGYVNGSVASSDVRFVAGTEALTTGMLANPSFTDNPAITNLTLTWNGGPFHMGTTTPNSGPPEVNFTLTALSTFGSTAFDGYTSTAVKSNGTAIGQPTSNVGPVGVPIAAAVPEPASWALMILGFGGVGALMRRRRSDVALWA